MTGHVGSADQQTLAKIGSQLLKMSSTDPATPDDFAGEKNVAIFLHGFTANSSYMTPLMKLFEANGFNSLAYNYPCYDGIDTAALALFEHLSHMNKQSHSALSKRKVALIGHSMGGLVARAFVSMHQGQLFVRKVITLGTPNDGTLTDSKVLECVVSWSEALSGFVKGGYSKSSRSAMQLMGKDCSPTLLTRLTQAATPSGSVQFYSLSGGKGYLEFGMNPIMLRAANLLVQNQLNSKPNDGLVVEKSSDLSQPQFSICAPDCEHFNNYSEYTKTNHTNLVNDQIIGNKIIEFVNAP